MDSTRLTSSHDSLSAAQSASLARLLTKLMRCGSEIELYKSLARYLADVVDSDRASVALLAPGQQEVELHGLSGESGTLPLGKRLPVASTGIGHAVSSGRIVRWEASVNSPYLEASALLEQGMTAVMNAPISVSNNVIGTLNVAAREAYLPQAEILFCEIASMVSANIERFRAVSNLRQALKIGEDRAKRLEALNKGAKAMSAALSADEVYDIVFSVADRLLPASRVSIAMLTPDGHHLQIIRLADQCGRSSDGSGIPTLPVKSTPLAGAMNSNEPIIRNDLSGSKFSFDRELANRGHSAAITIPITTRNGLVFMINAALSGGQAINDDYVIAITALSTQFAAVLDRIEAQDQLAAKDRKIASLVNDCPLMMMTLDRDMRVVQVSDFGASVLGYQADRLRGSKAGTLFAAQDRSECLKQLRRVIDQPLGDVASFDAEMVDSHGDKFWVKHTVRRLDDDSAPVLVVCENISEVKALSEQLAHDASHDALTGFPNRREFDRRLALVHAELAPGSVACICCFDIDHFKTVNDTAGHAGGDSLLRLLTSELSNVLSKEDTIARLGGDEFAVILNDCTLENAMNVAEQLRATAEAQLFSWEGRHYPFSISVGVSTLERGPDGVIKTLRNADMACYVAKSNGRNQVSASTPLTAKHHSAVHCDGEWGRRIRQAFSDDRLHLAAQPIKKLTGDNGLLRFETLIRLQDGTELIPAGQFIPAAERLGLITEIDDWVVSTLLTTLQDGYPATANIDFVTINLSTRSIESENFLDRLMGLLQAHPLLSAKLVFEITETSAISRFNLAKHFIESVKTLGARFALDDFGAGFSTFHYLKQLPIEYLKIDGSLIRDIESDRINIEIVRSITQVADVLGLKTVAEFVERESTASILASLDIDYVQGYGVGQPVLLLEYLRHAEPLRQVS